MNNEKIITDAPLSEKAPIYKQRKTVIILSAILALLILLNAALAVLLAIGEKDESEAKTSDTFDYAGANIKDYLAAFSPSIFTGKTFAGKEYAIDDVDDEYIVYYINNQLLSKAVVANSGYVNKTMPIDYADKVYFYILDVKKVADDGVTLEDIDNEYFINAYAQLGELQIGAQILGKEFDEKLLGKAPNELGNTVFRDHGYAADGGETVFVISYEATVDGEDTAYTTVNGMRLDTATASGALEDAVIAKLKSDTVALGETFKLDLTHDIDEDEKDESVHYSVTVNAAVTETSETVIAALPDDYFGEKDEYAALNGETLAFSVIVDYSVAYEIAYESADENGDAVKKTVEGFESLTAEYIKNTLGFETDKTSDEDVRAAYFAETKKTVEDSLESTRKANAVNLIWKGLVDGTEFDTLPKEALDELTESAVKEFINYYYQYTYQDPSFAMMYPTVEDYARAYFGYGREEYESYKEYIEKEYAPYTVKQQLLLYAIYNSGAIEDAYGKYIKLLDEQVDALIKSAAESDVTVTRDEALENLYSQRGIAYVQQSFITQIVNDYLYEKNTVDWALSEESDS